MTNVEFSSLVERARGIKMTSGDRESQRRSFAFGNANIENEAVTREVVDRAAERLAIEPNLTEITGRDNLK
jgi:hypothetical protein